MKYVKYDNCNFVNGEGIRCVLWVSGCSHGCHGCFNTSSWNPKSGEEVTDTFVSNMIEDLSQPHIQGLTLSGGDSMHRKNYEDTIKLCQRIKYELPDKDITLYTGYTLDQLQKDLLRCGILDWIDVLIDGKYEKDNPTDLPFRGSRNQRRYKLEKGVATLID